MLYRTLLPVLLFASTTTPAPQDVTNSDITYVKVKPLTANNQPEPTRFNRESKIENIPLSIPGITNPEEKSTENSEAEKAEAVIQPDITFKNNRSEISPKNNRTESPKQSDSIQQPDLTFKNNRSEINPKNNRTDTPKQSDSNQTESNQPETDIEPSGSNLAETLATDDTQIDSIPSDTILSDTRTKIDYTTANYDSAETTETAEALTERYEDEETESRKYPSSRSFPKLSHKRKANGFSFTANLIDKPEKRKFKSTCKCMKIWNCPKLQISVGRCAEEYFLCCV